MSGQVVKPKGARHAKVVVEARELSKTYRLYDSPRDRLRELLSPTRRRYHHAFRALDGVSFSVEKGQALGIIGMNGSGKSTLLKIICGVLRPSAGDVQVDGRLAALLELGAGFNPEFSGRENVYINGALLGIEREEMDRRFPDIEAFAEIGEFVDQPVKTYSSGMFVRLAFAAAINVDPDILVVDEALSVGDVFFQHRCIAKIESFQAAGHTVLFVTHDINLAKSFCTTVLLLNEGKILAQGDPEYATEQYLMLTRRKQSSFLSGAYRVDEKSRSKLDGATVSFGSEGGQILDVSILDANRRPGTAFLAGEPIHIRVRAAVSPEIKHPSVSVILRDHRGYNVYGTSTALLGQTLRPDGAGRFDVRFSLKPALRAGSYSLMVSLDDFRTPALNMLLDRQAGVGAFQVVGHETTFYGVVDLQAEVTQEPGGEDARPSRAAPRPSWEAPAAPGPVVVGAVGGSGTRVVARIVQSAGYFIGAHLNESEDAMEFVEFYDRWINRVLRAGDAALEPAAAAEMTTEFESCLARHRDGIVDERAPWGWKEPRSIYLLPFFHARFPEMRFIHVVRDGRDMAFSANQNQLRKHGGALLGDAPAALPQPVRTAMLWNRINLSANEYGNDRLRGRYLRVRFEDLCADASTTIRVILRFLGADESQADELAREVVAPDSIGRWRDQPDAALRRAVEDRAREALKEFGYL